MSRRSLTCLLTGAVLLALGLTCLPAPAQFPQPLPKGPQYPQLPPLLHVRFVGPPGMRVTFFRGAPTGHTLEAPFVVGLRPGYLHRVQVSNIPGHPGLTLFPTLEVRGAILVPPPMRLADHPAALTLTAEDLGAAKVGALVTRVIAIERPENAAPIATTPDRPLEYSTPPGGDPVKEAKKHGRVLLVMHLGQLQIHPTELAHSGTPGTILLPGERVLPPPRDPPCFPWTGAPVSDPRLGPYPISEEICFHDGGDIGLPAGLDPNGQLRGLEPSDTVAEYATSKGQRRVCPSNRVCICAPRYVTARGESGLGGNQLVYKLRDTNVAHVQAHLNGRNKPEDVQQREGLSGLVSRIRASGTENITTTSVIGKIEGLAIVGRVQEVWNITGSCPKPECRDSTMKGDCWCPPGPEPPEGCLRVIKWPDKCDPKIGEVVTFFVRYSNTGGRPISDIAVSDSLTARLEYVPGSARSDRPSNLTTQPNEAGSVTIRWQITGSLPPGQSGVVSFQARVR